MYSRFIHFKKNRGFSLLLAVLVGSLLLSVSLGIFGLAIKQSIITSGAKDSAYALYAADSGIECALYYDVYYKPGGNGGILGAFGTSTSVDNRSLIKCNGAAVTSIGSILDGSSGNVKAATTTFKYNLPPISGASTPCVVVSVGKYETGTVPPNETFLIRTIVEARGYNSSCPPSTNPRLVERGLFIRY